MIPSSPSPLSVSEVRAYEGSRTFGQQTGPDESYEFGQFGQFGHTKSHYRGTRALCARSLRQAAQASPYTSTPAFFMSESQLVPAQTVVEGEILTDEQADELRQRRQDMSAGDIRREICLLYRQARRGRITAKRANDLATILRGALQAEAIDADQREKAEERAMVAEFIESQRTAGEVAAPGAQS